MSSSNIGHFYLFEESTLGIINLVVIGYIVQVLDHKFIIDKVDALYNLRLWNDYLPGLSIWVINIESYYLTVGIFQVGLEVESGPFIGDISEIAFPFCDKRLELYL